MTSIPAAITGIASATSNTAVGILAFSSNGGPALVGWNGSLAVDPNNDFQGVIGQTENSHGTGVEGSAKATSGNTVGVRGSTKSPTGVGIQGDDGGAGGFAGLFNGKVAINGPLQVSSQITGGGGGGAVSVSGGLNIVGQVNISGGGLSVGGALTKQSGTFKIDHPLDPAGKFLYHSFVERRT
jgi:hypothetical protein